MAKNEEHPIKKTFPRAMKIRFPYTVNINFPGDLEYIPAIRKFIAELLQVSNFSQKFSYRSEIIIDELCNNAVTYGCRTDNAHVELINTIYHDRIEFSIRDEGGTKEHLRRLKSSIKRDQSRKKEQSQQGMGLQIVRMLSERIDVVINEDNLTSVHVVRKKEDEGE